jgi:hypothetical protein
MSGRQAFSWRGEPIHDIESWAASRGEEMVRVRETRRGISMVTFQPYTDVEEYDVPDSFWRGMCVSQGIGGEGYRREEIGRRLPVTDEPVKEQE